MACTGQHDFKQAQRYPGSTHRRLKKFKMNLKKLLIVSKNTKKIGLYGVHIILQLK